MECFNLIYAHCVYLVNIPEPVLYEIYTLDFPFDLRCESVTYVHMYLSVYSLLFFIF